MCALLRPMMIAFYPFRGVGGTGRSAAVNPSRQRDAARVRFASALRRDKHCLMGGIALEGGIGNVIGIAIGLFTLRFLVTGMAALGAPYYVQNLAVGALLIWLLSSSSC